MAQRSGRFTRGRQNDAVAEAALGQNFGQGHAGPPDGDLEDEVANLEIGHHAQDAGSRVDEAPLLAPPDGADGGEHPDDADDGAAGGHSDVVAPEGQENPPDYAPGRGSAMSLDSTPYNSPHAAGASGAESIPSSPAPHHPPPTSPLQVEVEYVAGARARAPPVRAITSTAEALLPQPGYALAPLDTPAASAFAPVSQRAEAFLPHQPLQLTNMVGAPRHGAPVHTSMLQPNLMGGAPRQSAPVHASLFQPNLMVGAPRQSAYREGKGIIEKSHAKIKVRNK